MPGTQELTLAETREHTLKMSRWAKDAALAIADRIFIPVIMEIMFRARAPLVHWFLWMESETSNSVVEIDGVRRKAGALAQMVWYKAKRCNYRSCERQQ